MLCCKMVEMFPASPSGGRVGLTQISFTVRENEPLVLVCAQFTKYNIRPDCPMEAIININFATLNNTAGMYTMYMYCSQYSHNVICRYMYVCVFAPY